MEDIKVKRSFSQWFFGEYSWTLKFVWIVSLMVFFTIGYNTEKSFWTLLVEGDFNSAFLLIIIGYLSDFRYRIVKESRNN